MAKFIEYKSDPSWTAFISWCLGAVIPLLAVILFLRGVVSTTGFVVIVACGIGVLLILTEQVERRFGIVTEVVSGKLPKRTSKSVDHSVLEFREDPFGRRSLVMVSCITVLIFTIAQKTKAAGAPVGPVIVASALLLLCPAVLWVNLVRLRIQGDEVQVIYFLLGRWRSRTFRFGEIASVKVREGRRVGKEVRLVLHDGSSIRYMKRDGTVIDELLEVLKRGVAEAKPAPPDWSELA
jgi:hypothetical protein